MDAFRGRSAHRKIPNPSGRMVAPERMSIGATNVGRCRMGKAAETERGMPMLRMGTAVQCY